MLVAGVHGIVTAPFISSSTSTDVINFSFNTVVGKRTKANGFYQAIEYAYGDQRMGYGGGVCQASTTMYLAAAKANMTILKREPHSDAVGYLRQGRDGIRQPH